MRELSNIPFCSSRSCRLGIAGPDLVLVLMSVLMPMGRDGPRTSSSLLTSAATSVPKDWLDSLPSAAPRNGELVEAAALCNVAGSYHPSASSPRFLRDVSNGFHKHRRPKVLF